MNALIPSGFPSSHSGVIFTSSSHGIPIFSASTALTNLGKNSAVRDAGTQTGLIAVQRCALNENAPDVHYCVASAMSASSKIIAQSCA
jgi:hypothetical protein